MKRNLYRITIRTTPAKHKTNASQARGAGTHIGHRASRPYHARNIHAAHALVRNEKHTSKQARGLEQADQDLRGLLQPVRIRERLKAIVFLFPRPPAASPAAPAAIDGPTMIAGKLDAAGAARFRIKYGNFHWCCSQMEGGSSMGRVNTVYNR